MQEGKHEGRWQQSHIETKTPESNEEDQKVLDAVNKIRSAFSLPAVVQLPEWEYSMNNENPVNDPLGEMLQGLPEFSLSGASFEFFNIDSKAKAEEIATNLNSAGVPSGLHESTNGSYAVQVSLEFSRPLVEWTDWYANQLPFHRSGGKTSKQRDQIEET